jgi:hypothetical protein
MSATPEHPCRECGHALTSAASIALGIGPTCLKRERERAGTMKRTMAKTQKSVYDPNQLLLFPVAVEL